MNDFVDEQADDLDADLRAALAGLETPEPAPEPEVKEAVEAKEPSKPVEKVDEKGRVRGEDGKFVAKPDEVGQDQPAQDPKAQAEPSQSAIRPPVSWAPEAKAQFATLSPAVQAAINKREQEIDQGLRMKDKDVKRYEPLEQVIAPHRQKWAVAGVDEATAVKQLLEASDWLERDPKQALAYLARQYGVDLAQPTGGQPSQAQPQGTAANPEFLALQQELAQIKQQIGSQQEAGMLSQIESFRQDPKNLYFDNVRDDMAALISTGKAKDLPEAYEMACWMRPDIRPLLQQAQVIPAPSGDVARKRAAGASVTGSPAEPRTIGNNPNATIEDDIRNAILELSGR